MAIVLLLVYFNASFGIGFDFHYCGHKLVNVKLVAFGKTDCRCGSSQMKMDCCKNESIFCQADNHTIQSTAAPLPFSITDHLNPNAFNAKVQLFDPNLAWKFEYYHFTRRISSRQILALNHILRI
jgi:hypothetical protein